MSYDQDLLDSLKKIFDLDKVTYDNPSDSQEQEGIFVEVSNSINNIRDTTQTARVYGKVRIFVQHDKMPFDFITKQIAMANRKFREETAKFFFFDLDENVGRYQNIAERSFSFIYFYKGQYDPSRGRIDEIIFNEVAT